MGAGMGDNGGTRGCLMIVSFAGLCLLLTVAPPKKAEPKPNTLTPQEVADGWVLLFDGETACGWEVAGDAKVRQGVLTVGGKDAGSFRTTARFRTFELRFRYRVAGKKEARCGIAPDSKRQLRPGEGRGWNEATFSVGGNRFRGTYYSPSGGVMGGGGLLPIVPEGSFYVSLEASAGTTLEVRDVKLRPTDMPLAFNGKDLTGWKEIAGRKSKFAVTPTGELSIKDGPGDIQTEKEWDDFVLQLECRTNGKHLNSGVFVRCVPGEFWSGYEAQIRNQWEGDDRKKPVDFGTGGIYFLQAARKVVSSDNEWFTMTVVANGPHLAVWVNGYQTADYTDKRPAGQKAREGLRLEKGPISLQGHDPTTDLLFRNIRVAELPNK